MDAVLLGSGWRAAFYIRIARLLPEVLSIKKIYTRSFERAKKLREEGLDATDSLHEALSCKHDIVIVSSGPTGFADLLRRLKADGETVFCETTFLSLSDDENREFEDMKGFSRHSLLNSQDFSEGWHGQNRGERRVHKKAQGSPLRREDLCK